MWTWGRAEVCIQPSFPGLQVGASLCLPYSQRGKHRLQVERCLARDVKNVSASHLLPVRLCLLAVTVGLVFSREISLSKRDQYVWVEEENCVPPLLCLSCYLLA